MKKVALFVEGHTELIFVREYILKSFDYLIDIQCRTLFSDGHFNSAEFDFSNPEATIHFQIINVGNDNAVMSRMLKREGYLWSQGYDSIICLRDMYSKEYRDITTSIDSKVISDFITGAKTTISLAQKPGCIDFVFAIMEVESWFLGSIHLFVHLDARLTPEFIHGSIGIDFNSIDPEKEIFHPAKTIGDIYKLAELNYSKHKKDIEAIASNYTKQDFIDLYIAAKCRTFNFFVDCIRSRIA